ncbi:MAG: phytoene/squalene synthase family protein [Chloroflexi bacterium CFX4]|nr:phytoene/squalene synthase family protein [Chloroflexi bacterium CFX4]MDL1922654.1 phytoene/squalene synthase family protein [Chloroflexi bacterium CFX3]
MQVELPTTNWEYRLLARALEALDSHPSAQAVPHSESLLEESYAYCESLTRLHSRTFYMASGLLPYEKRRAVRALYAFCRVTDNIVDDSQSAARAAHLEAWQHTVSMAHPPASEPVAVAWADAQARYRIPKGYAQQLIRGCAADLYPRRYETFADLAEYAYGVASTVGLMAMHIIGFTSDEAIPYAVKLGVALQVTNVLRDVGEDWRNGRLYLPQDELAAFGVSEQDIAAGRLTENWRAFMRYQIARNRQLYAESWAGIALLNSEGRFAIAAAAELYRAILNDIEANDYDVFRRRARVSTLGKLRRLPIIWRKARRARPNTQSSA